MTSPTDTMTPEELRALADKLEAAQGNEYKGRVYVWSHGCIDINMGNNANIMRLCEGHYREATEAEVSTMCGLFPEFAAKLAAVRGA